MSDPLVILTLFLTVAVVIGIGLEILSVMLLRRISLTQQRIDRQMPSVLQLRHRKDGKWSVLLLGNSGLIHAIDSRLLQDRLKIDCALAPLFVDATSYFDWFYGLRRIFALGCQPDLVVLALAATSFLQTQVRKDYFSATLLNRADILRISRDLDYGVAGTASLYLGSISCFWSHRGVIRARLLSMFTSDEEIRRLSTEQKPKRKMSDERIDAELRRVAAPRLAALKELCHDRQTRLALLLPPIAERNDHLSTMSEIASAVGVEVLLPMSSAMIDSKDFPDGVHLSSTLVHRFTNLTASAIRQLVSSSAVASQAPFVEAAVQNR